MGSVTVPMRSMSLKSIKEEIRDHINCDFISEETGNRIIHKIMEESFRLGHVYHSVNRKTFNPSGDLLEEHVYAVVTLYRSDSCYGSLGLNIKHVDERCGPIQKNPTLKILRELSPAGNFFSLNWRKECLDNFKRVSPELRNKILSRVSDDGYQDWDKE